MRIYIISIYMKKFFLYTYISIYLSNYFFDRLCSKLILFVMLPIIEAFTIFPCIERKIIKKYGTIKNYLEQTKKTVSIVEKDTTNINSEYYSEKVYFIVLCIFTSTMFALLSLIFDWHFMQTILYKRPWLSFILTILPSSILLFSVGTPTNKQKERTIIYIRKHSKRECILLMICYLTILLSISLCWILMLYIIFNIMNDNVSSYQAIEIFFNNLSRKYGIINR